MSDVVVRMELPKSCAECRERWLFARCSEYTGSVLRRSDRCPIICALPENHGRLVDADALKQKKYHSNITHENAVAVAEIDWMPTIVPETEGGKHEAD